MTNQAASPGSSSSSFDPYSADSPGSPMETISRTLSLGPQPSSENQAPDSTGKSASRQSKEPSNYNSAIEESEDMVLPDRQPLKRKRKAAGNGLDQNQEVPLGNGVGYGTTEEEMQLPPGLLPLDRSKRIKFNGSTSQALETSLDKSTLPGEVWQYIFTFLPPASLGRLMQVNKAFKNLLTADFTSELSAKRTTLSSLQYVHPNFIWSSSRKLFHPGMPRPLSTMSEQEMWRLVCGTECQFCKKPGDNASPEYSLWESGPGPSGVRIVWPFALRACSECVQNNCEKEMDLLFSSSLPSLLVPAIPFAFFTSSMHFVSSVVLRSNQPPTGLNLTKFYLKSHIEAMKAKFEEVKSLGPAAAEEWVKGLEGEGKEKLVDSARWEQWEHAGGLRSVRAATSHLPGRSNGEFSELGGQESSTGTSSGVSSPPTGTASRHGRLSFSSNTHVGNAHHRSERSIHDVNEAKASRKAEIERRCAELDPPLNASVLNHMDTFLAAIQIPHHFTDRDWDILKPRLLSQREMAERRESERIKQDKILHAKSEERRQQEAQLKEAKDMLDKEWEEVQKPIRERMATYADEIIREGWRDGEAVVKDKCPKFAADVLMYVRNKFYSDLAKEDAAARSLGNPIEEDLPGAPPKRKLVLENMKWIFDQKIKPLTDPLQKELFLCNGCENNTKYYGFEGVVQHYAAKHTSVLSLGSVVVHWRSAWPEQPPFHPDPGAARALMFAMPRPTMAQPGMGYQGNPIAPDTYPQMSPAPYRRTPYTPYAYGSGPYRPPSPPGSQYYPPQQGYPYPAPQPGYPPNGPYDPHAPPPPNPVYGSPYPGPGYPPPYAGPDARAPAPYPGHYGPQPHASQFGPPFPNNPHGQQSRGPPNSHKNNPNSQAYGFYQAQVEEIAKTSRTIWNNTSGVKDFPHNARAHVILHHVAARFADRYGHEPPLALVSDALNSHPQMKPIKNLSGLACNSCSHHLRRGRGGQERKTFSLTGLISHFLSVHLARDVPPPDWKTKMVALPEDEAISSLFQLPGMDNAKFDVVGAAFPSIFGISPPKPSNGNPARQERLAAKRDQIAGSRNHPANERLHNRDQLEVAVDNFPKFMDSPLGDGENPPEPPKEDEYDPHRPAFIEPVRDQYGRLENRRPPPRSSATMSARDPSHPAQGPESAIGELREHPRVPHVSLKGETETKAYAKTNPRRIEADLGTGIGAESRLDTDRSRTHTRNVSEDGEVAEPAPLQGAKVNLSPPGEELSAAERFLSSFVPGQDPEEYKPGPSDVDRSNDRSRWLEPEDGDERRWRGEAGSVVEGGVAGDIPRGGWAARTNSPSAARSHRDFDPRFEASDKAAASVRRAGMMSPDLTEARHGRRPAARPESRHEHNTRRPHSRFDRYEAQRQESLRPRSRSPTGHDAAPPEPTFYRDRSPRGPARRPVYSEYAPTETYYDRVPAEHPGSYTRVPSHAQYQYMEDPRYADRPFEGAVEYIPVRFSGREPQNPPTYYIERPVPRDAPKEYIDYEMEYRRPPTYEDPGQFYPAETVPRHTEGAGALPRRGRYR